VISIVCMCMCMCILLGAAWSFMRASKEHYASADDDFVGYEVSDPTLNEVPLDVINDENDVTTSMNRIAVPAFDAYPQDNIMTTDYAPIQLRDEWHGDDTIPELEQEMLVPSPVDPTMLYQQYVAPLPEQNVVTGGGVIEDDASW